MTRKLERPTEYLFLYAGFLLVALCPVVTMAWLVSSSIAQQQAAAEPSFATDNLPNEENRI